MWIPTNLFQFGTLNETRAIGDRSNSPVTCCSSLVIFKLSKASLKYGSTRGGSAVTLAGFTESGCI